MSDATLAALARWYAAQCDGEWEHHNGVSIQSCDNPGWWVKINLKGALAQRPFAPVGENVINGHPQGPRWLDCHIKDGVWHGAGDETRLQEIITRFLAWAQA